MSTERTTYPWFPVKHWWALRDRFNRSLPAVVTPQYLTATLSVGTSVARDVLTGLKLFGLVDHENRPAESAELWRHDDTYAQVCEQILKTVYPAEVDAIPSNSESDRSSVERWFSGTTRSGIKHAKKMAALYWVIREADCTKAPDGTRAGKAEQRAAQSAERKRRHIRAHAARVRANTSDTLHAPELPLGRPTDLSNNPESAAQQPTLPALSINLHFHLAPDTSQEQIDRILHALAGHFSLINSYADNYAAVAQRSG